MNLQTSPSPLRPHQSPLKPRLPRANQGRNGTETENHSSNKPPALATISTAANNGNSNNNNNTSCFPSPRKSAPTLFTSDSFDVLSSPDSKVCGNTLDSNNVMRRIPCLTTTLKKQLTVRALFDYDPSTDTGLPGRGLAFRHGDILHVVNATDQEWWQARRLTLYLNENYSATPSLSTSTTNGSSLATRTSLGIIPSRQRIERRQRARLKHVNFFSKVTVIGSAPVNANPSNASASMGDRVGSTPVVSSNAAAAAAGSVPNSPVANGQEGEGQVLEGNSTTLDRVKKSAHLTQTEGGRSNSLTRSFLKRFSMRNRQKTTHLPLTGSPALSISTSDADVDSIRSYEPVKRMTISLARPLLIFGPLKERVIDTLVQDAKFTTCVPHTSRPPRPGEQEGVDYHFVASKLQMEEEIKSDRFVEVGQFQDHYYATSIDSVRRTLQTGRVCVLDVGLPAVRRLELAGLYPISVLLKPHSVQQLRAVQTRLTEDQAKRSIDLAVRLEADNWRMFSLIVNLESVEDAVLTIKQFVLLHGGPVIWVPSGLANADEMLLLLGQGSQSSTLPRGTRSNLSGGGGGSVGASSSQTSSGPTGPR